MKRKQKASRIDILKGKKASPSVPSLKTLSVQDALCMIQTGNNFSKGENRVSECFIIIQNASQTRGLSSDDILCLLDIVGNKTYGQSFSRRLIKCMIPTEFISESIVIQAISWICCGRLPFIIQVDLFKWILIALDFIDEIKRLPYLFGVIFVFIDSDVLSPYVCQLLCRLAENYHVVSSRVKHLTDLLSKLGPQPHILALLEIFGSFRPDLVSYRCNYKHVFRPLTMLPVMLQRTRNNLQKQKSAPVSKKINTISQATCAEIKSFHELSDIMQCLKGPESITKLINCPLRRILFTSYLPRELLNQFCFWIRVSLISELPWKFDTMQYSREKVLNVVSEITAELQEGIPEAERFVEAYLRRWDGMIHLDHIMNIIEHWGICPFEDFQEAILCPVYEHFCTAPFSYKCSVLECLTQLYQHWVLWEIPRYQASKTESLRASHSSSNSIYIFDRKLVDLDPYHEVEALAIYIQKLCASTLNLHPDHPFMLIYCILRFFEMVLDVHSSDLKAPLLLPPPLVVSVSALSSNAVILSQLCKLLIRFKKEVHSIKNVPGHSIQMSTVSSFNTFIIDICNMLWRSRAFSPEGSTAIFPGEIPLHVNASISDANEAFTFCKHPSMLGFVLQFLISLKKKNITPDNIYKDSVVRNAYMQHLSDSGMKDVVLFINTFIRSSTTN